MLRRWFTLVAVPAVAAAALLMSTPDVQARGGGHGGGGGGGRGGGGGWHGGGGGWHGGGGGFNGGRGGFYGGGGRGRDFDRGRGFGLGYGGWGYPGYYGYYGDNYDYSPGYAYDNSYPSYNYDYSSGDSSYGYSSAYPAESSDASVSSAPNPNSVLLNVRVPPNATVWVDGEQTRQTGPVRQFVSPPLDPGQDYGYDIRAEWNQNGQRVDQTRHVTVHAGDRRNINFLTSRNQSAPAATRTDSTAPAPAAENNRGGSQPSSSDNQDSATPRKPIP